jgi:hypothetical protein
MAVQEMTSKPSDKPTMMLRSSVNLHQKDSSFTSLEVDAGW